MIVAIASGKGGTGKTTVAASLVRVWERPLWAVDLDVEEPNLHLFLNPRFHDGCQAWMEVPRVDADLCAACGACSELCQFKAITLLGSTPLVFTEMCHGCGGCLAVCPSGAITPARRELGEIAWGSANDANFIMGRLRVGEAMSPPLMHQVRGELARRLAAQGGDAIMDAPPGVSCPAVSAVMDAEVIVLVTEPTPFGLFDLKLAHEAFAPLGKAMGVVINRAGLGRAPVRQYCQRQGLPVLAEIPFLRAVAEAYAQGRVVAEVAPQLKQMFRRLAHQIQLLGRGARGEAVVHG